MHRSGHATSIDVAPGLADKDGKYPEGQVSQVHGDRSPADDPKLSYVPIGQISHSPVHQWLLDPGVKQLHFVLSSLDEPEAQAEHVLAPIVLLAFPASHATQVVEAAELLLSWSVVAG